MMKNSREMSDLVAFLIDGSSSLDSVSRFLLQNTLAEFEPVSIFLAFIKPDGSMSVSAGFGYGPEANPDIYGRSLRSKTLVDDAFRHNKVVIGGSYKEFVFKHPPQANRLFPDGFEDSIAIPMSFLGVMVVCSEKKFHLTPNVEFFFKIVGEVIALHAARLNAESTHKIHQESLPSSENISALTSRQSVVLSAILHGSTNRTIAGELGFSESLIRHETVEIYRKLNVSGRKELLEREETFQPAKLHTIA